MEFSGQFSDREKAVIELLLQGKSNKQIAFSLGVTSRTVEFHLGNIYSKLGISSRSEAILMITRNYALPPGWLANDGLRESTVVLSPGEDDNDAKSKSPRRSLMRKKVFTSLGLLAGVLIVFFVFSWSGNTGGRDNNPGAASPIETATALNQTSVPSHEQAALGDVKNENTYTQTVGDANIKLILNWFYIDSGRVNLEVTVCDLPLPDGFKPVYFIDPGKIKIYKADGTPIELVRRVNYGGGSGGEEDKPSEEEVSCYWQSFDYSLREPQPTISQEELFILDIPVGGLTSGENGELKSIPSATFHLDVKSIYGNSLTFTSEKTAVIENKAITFKGVEVNLSSVVVILCVLDPLGEQWLPKVNLLYRGNIIYPGSSGLVDGSNENPDEEMCYRLNYTYTFGFDSTDVPENDLSVLVTKLTKDQPERLPYGLIASAQHELAAEGIEFSYVIVNHGSDIMITKKPEELTEAEALRKVQESLVEDATSSELIVFDLK